MDDLEWEMDLASEMAEALAQVLEELGKALDTVACILRNHLQDMLQNTQPSHHHGSHGFPKHDGTPKSRIEIAKGQSQDKSRQISQIKTKTRKSRTSVIFELKSESLGGIEVESVHASRVRHGCVTGASHVRHGIVTHASRVRHGCVTEQ